MGNNKKPENEKDEARGIANATAGVLSNSLANLAIALGLIMLVKWVGYPVFDYFNGADERPQWLTSITLAILFGVIFSDPYEAWKTRRLSYRFIGKFALGFAFGFIPLSSDWGAGGETGEIANQVNGAGEGEGKGLLSWAPWFAILLPIAMMPILFGSHALDRFEKNKSAPMKERLSDAALEYVDTSGPVIMMAVMGVCMLFYWIVGMRFDLLVAFLTMIVIGMILYSAVFYDGSQAPVTDDEDYEAPRSSGFGEAVSKALDVSVGMLPGALVMTGLIWVAMAFWDVSEMKIAKGDATNALAIIWPVLKAGLVALVVVPGGMVVATVAGALGIGGWAQVRGMGMDEAKMRADKFSEILYCGVMGKLFHASLEERDE